MRRAFSVLLVMLAAAAATVLPAAAQRGGGNYYYQGIASSIIAPWGDSCDEIENVADWSMRTQIWGNFTGSNLYIDRIDVINETNISLQFGQYTSYDNGGAFNLPLTGINPNSRATYYPRRWITGVQMVHHFTVGRFGHVGACFNAAPIQLSFVRY
ncbi:hypothetical protein JOF53_007304 [Crossiella equi]|uniref:Uncharacterized protein n=1 Tax=Crossiella equi TaxID=130796 RepID=A0ABS5APD3_9PSEU|nr:hypothetical protein [Crossiella equi]MBP2478432.1 hypothetical protein [Crossiella equi]